MSIPEQTCVKCPRPGIYFNTDRRKAVYCLECFIKMIKHKFAYSLGTNRIYRDGKSKQTIVVYTGNTKSAVLLSLIKHGMTHDTHKRLQIIPKVVAVFDELDETKIDELYKKTQKMAESFPWNWSSFHVSSVFDQFSSLENNFDPKNLVLYEKLLSSVSSNSDRTELKRLLFDFLIWRIANCCAIDKIMVAKNVESLSNVSFNALCFGRGSSLSDLTSVVDKRNFKVSIIRPMREICDKEVQFLSEHENSADYILKKHNTISCPSGIQGLTSNFLNSLQSGGFPATMTTILSVSQKVEPLNKSHEKCLFCLISYPPEETSHLIEPKCCLPCNNIFKEIKCDDSLAILLRIIRTFDK